jgi:hypothetical protein
MGRIAFISYASGDEAAAEQIGTYLESAGTPCWIASRDVRPGTDYAAEIIEAIERSTVLVLVLSENANSSVFVKREVERAVSKGKQIFSVRLQDVKPSKALELFISSAEWIDAWPPPIERHLGRLAESIESAAPSSPAPLDRPPVQGRLSAGSSATAAPAGSSGPGNEDRKRGAPFSLVAALGLAVALLLGWILFRQPSPDSASVSVARSLDQGRPKTQGPSAPDTSILAEQPPAVQTVGPTGPCPESLAINHDLPTPFTCTCGDQEGSSGAVWGTDVYTDDSNLCRSAVHAGVIRAQGGDITVLRIGGRALYIGTNRNGVMSNDYGSYPTSIQFRGAPPPEPGPIRCPVSISINRSVQMPFTCRCTSGSTGAGAVWGTDIYTDDSSICRAALHAGVIPASGGAVTLNRADGRALYVGTTRNGVMSNDYGAYPSSMTFAR